MKRSCKRWSEDDIAILKSEYSKADLNSLAQRLGCTVMALCKKASGLGIKRGQFGNARHQKHDLEWFKKNYPRYSNRTLAVYLGTSLKYVKKMGNKYRLRKSPEYRKDCQEYNRARKIKLVYAWRARNPEKVKEYSRRYRLKKKMNYETNKKSTQEHIFAAG